MAFLSIGKSNSVLSLTIEHGLIKLVHSWGLELLDHRVMIANPQFFREGLVSSRDRIAGIIRNALLDMDGGKAHIVSAMPGFQSGIKLMTSPRAAAIDPAVFIPREAVRTMGISTDRNPITWYRMPASLDQNRWLVSAASRRAIASAVDTAQTAGSPIREMDLRPFALARVVNRPDALIAWVGADGCDVVVVKGSSPVEYRPLFWGAEPVDRSVMVTRLTEVIERTVAGYDQGNPAGPLSDDTPLFVCGSPLVHEPDIASQVAQNLQRPMLEIDPPVTYEAGFPIQDHVVNIGLVLRGR